MNIDNIVSGIIDNFKRDMNDIITARVDKAEKSAKMVMPDEMDNIYDIALSKCTGAKFSILDKWNDIFNSDRSLAKILGKLNAFDGALTSSMELKQLEREKEQTAERIEKLGKELWILSSQEDAITYKKPPQAASKESYSET